MGFDNHKLIMLIINPTHWLSSNHLRVLALFFDTALFFLIDFWDAILRKLLTIFKFLENAFKVVSFIIIWLKKRLYGLMIKFIAEIEDRSAR